MCFYDQYRSIATGACLQCPTGQYSLLFENFQCFSCSETNPQVVSLFNSKLAYLCSQNLPAISNIKNYTIDVPYDQTLLSTSSSTIIQNTETPTNASKQLDVLKVGVPQNNTDQNQSGPTSLVLGLAISIPIGAISIVAFTFGMLYWRSRIMKRKAQNGNATTEESQTADSKGLEISVLETDKTFKG